MLMLVAAHDRSVPVDEVDECLRFVLTIRDVPDQVLEELRVIAMGPGGSMALDRALDLLADFAPIAMNTRALVSRDEFICRLLARPDVFARAHGSPAFVEAPRLGELVAQHIPRSGVH